MATILVTGMGALIGQGIALGLRAAGAHRIVGLDRKPGGYGASLCDAFEAKPDVDEGSGAYLQFWKDMLARHAVDLVLPGISVDMYFLDAHRDILGAAARLGLNTPDLISITRDKLRFHDACAALALPRIPTSTSPEWDAVMDALGAPPLILKPRRGEGSQGIERLETAQDFAFFTTRAGDNWMVQRIVGSAEAEYTVGAFGLGGGDMLDRMIVMRRTLTRAGNTGFAEIVENETITEASRAILKHFKPVGPTNLQFRLERDTPYLLEINPRFSSSCSLRTAFGFNEAAMSVDHYLHGVRPAEPTLRTGHAVRYSADFVSHARDHL